MDATWRDERPVAMTSASASDERPSRSMVTMSSALSSSSALTMRSRSSKSFFGAGGGVCFSTFAGAVTFLTGLMAFGFAVFAFTAFFAGLAALLAFAALVFLGAFFAPAVLRVRIHILQSNAAMKRTKLDV